MPSSTLSSIYGWALYLIASVAFLSVASVPVSTEAQGSSRHQLESLADGIAASLNSVAPGLTITLQYHSSLPDLRVWVGGHRLTAGTPSLRVDRNLTWWSPTLSLQDGVPYLVSLNPGGLALAEKGFG